MNICYEFQIRIASLSSAYRVSWVYSRSEYWLGRFVIHTFHRWIRSKIWQTVKICFDRFKECALDFLKIFWRNAWWTLGNYKNVIKQRFVARHFLLLLLYLQTPLVSSVSDTNPKLAILNAHRELYLWNVWKVLRIVVISRLSGSNVQSSNK